MEQLCWEPPCLNSSAWPPLKLPKTKETFCGLTLVKTETQTSSPKKRFKGFLFFSHIARLNWKAVCVYVWGVCIAVKSSKGENETQERAKASWIYPSIQTGLSSSVTELSFPVWSSCSGQPTVTESMGIHKAKPLTELGSCPDTCTPSWVCY